MPGRRIDEGFGGPGLTLWSLGKTNSALHPSNGCASDGSQGHGSDQGWAGVSALSRRTTVLCTVVRRAGQAETYLGDQLPRPLYYLKRTSWQRRQMSENDPKRTL